jgi:glutaredoxin-like YruB-family protein
MKVVIYSTPTCHFCDKAKEFFKANDVKYTEYNVANDMPKRDEMKELSGGLTVPVITVGKEVIVGFEETKLRELLKI